MHFGFLNFEVSYSLFSETAFGSLKKQVSWFSKMIQVFTDKYFRTDFT